MPDAGSRRRVLAGWRPWQPADLRAWRAWITAEGLRSAGRAGGTGGHPALAQQDVAGRSARAGRAAAARSRRCWRSCTSTIRCTRPWIGRSWPPASSIWAVEGLIDAVLIGHGQGRQVAADAADRGLGGKGPKLSRARAAAAGADRRDVSARGLPAAEPGGQQKPGGTNQAAVPELIELAAAEGRLVKIGRRPAAARRCRAGPAATLTRASPRRAHGEPNPRNPGHNAEIRGADLRVPRPYRLTRREGDLRVWLGRRAPKLEYSGLESGLRVESRGRHRQMSAPLRQPAGGPRAAPRAAAWRRSPSGTAARVLGGAIRAALDEVRRHLRERRPCRSA